MQHEHERVKKDNERKRAQERRERRYIKIFMQDKQREYIEEVIRVAERNRAESGSGSSEADIQEAIEGLGKHDKEGVAKVEKKLLSEGFSAKDVSTAALRTVAMSSSQDMTELTDEARDWLVLYVPEHRLPTVYDPRGTQLEVVVGGKIAEEPVKKEKQVFESFAFDSSEDESESVKDKGNNRKSSRKGSRKDSKSQSKKSEAPSTATASTSNSSEAASTRKKIITEIEKMGFPAAVATHAFDTASDTSRDAVVKKLYAEMYQFTCRFFIYLFICLPVLIFFVSFYLFLYHVTHLFLVSHIYVVCDLNQAPNYTKTQLPLAQLCLMVQRN